MSMEIPPPPDPRALMAEFDLGAKKSFGQTFLRDQNMLHVSADAAKRRAPNNVVVEIGAGLGALTYHLLAVGLRVIAIERDRDLVPILQREFAWAGDRLTIREMDAAKLNYQALAEELGGPVTMAGNLPYQISSRLLVALAEADASIHASVVMVQKEVAERVVAVPRTKEYGLLSVLTQFTFDGEFVRIVPPEALCGLSRVCRCLEPEAETFEQDEVAGAIGCANSFSTRVRHFVACSQIVTNCAAKKRLNLSRKQFYRRCRAGEILHGYVALGKVLRELFRRLRERCAVMAKKGKRPKRPQDIMGNVQKKKGCRRVLITSSRKWIKSTES